MSISTRRPADRTAAPARTTRASRLRVLTRLTAAIGVGVAVAVAAAGPASAAIPAFGAVDGFAGANVSGWAASESCGGNPGSSPNGFCMQLRAFYDGPAGAGVPGNGWFTTSEVRPDVAAQIGGNGQVGFAHDVRVNAPLQFLDGAPHSVHIYAGGSSSEDPGTLIGSTTFATKVQTPVGHVDSTSGGVVAGWTYDPDAPNESNDVELDFATCAPAGAPYGPVGFSYDRVSVPADQQRDDVNQAFGITGAHGFSYTVPAEYRDSGCWQVTVSGRDTERSGDNDQVLTTFQIG